MARICVFGDSIIWGRGDYEYGGWVQRLRKFFDKKTLSTPENRFFLYNLGISADTTKGLLERFEFEVKRRLKEDEEKIIIFAIGVNDSCYLNDKNDLDTSPEEFKENIQKLIKITQKFSSKVIFVGLMPVDELRTTPIPYAVNKSYKNEYIKKYNEIIKLVCKENKIYFIDIFENWINSDYKKLLEDGLHPNSEGHQKIFEAVKEFLICQKI